MAEPTRRAFVIGAVGLASLCAVGGVGTALNGKGGILRPPGGQDAARFSALCIKCDRCRSACPESCITMATLENGILNARTPRLDFHKGTARFAAGVQMCVQLEPFARGSMRASRRSGARLSTRTSALHSTAAAVRNASTPAHTVRFPGTDRIPWSMHRCAMGAASVKTPVLEQLEGLFGLA